MLKLKDGIPPERLLEFGFKDEGDRFIYTTYEQNGSIEQACLILYSDGELKLWVAFPDTVSSDDFINHIGEVFVDLALAGIIEKVINKKEE